MKIKIISALLLCMVISACATQRYVVTEGTYSAWKGERMYLRKKTILLDTKTGETWGLAYDKNNKKYTRDGYGWQKLPMSSLPAAEQ